jgi:S-methylmethionine-dependent homocysteine/selenocysteine methylase
VTDVIVLDGGMGQELLRRTGSTPTSLWSADVMQRHPDAVVEVHRDYIDAGAEVITLNAYSATRCRLDHRGRADDYEPLQRLAVELAHRARTEAGADDTVRIAGCLSPFEWSYRPELAPPFDELVPHYAETVELQADGVDLFIAETMASADEGAAAAVAASASGLPVWLAWTLSDDRSGRLRSGETIAQAHEALQRRGAVVDALLVNCSLPESIDAALPDLRRAGDDAGVRIGAYANGFQPIDLGFTSDATVDVLDRRDDLDPDGYLRWVERWVTAGASIVGGCCEIGPAHIRAIADRFG